MQETSPVSIESEIRKNHGVSVWRSEHHPFPEMAEGVTGPFFPLNLCQVHHH